MSAQRKVVTGLSADRLWWEQMFDRAHFFRWHRLLGWPETLSPLPPRSGK